MDLGPTVLSLLNIEPPKHYDGKAIAGQFEESPREYAFGTAIDLTKVQICKDRFWMEGMFTLKTLCLNYL